jgi:hypothetical protein
MFKQKVSAMFLPCGAALRYLNAGSELSEQAVLHVGAKGFLFRTYAETKIYSTENKICTTYDEERRNPTEIDYRSKGYAVVTGYNK